MKNILSACVLVLLATSPLSYAVNPAVTEKSAVSVTTPQPAKANVLQDVININTADAQTLTNLKGVGIKKADAIIAWRKANGGFKTVDQFADVKGIGPKTLEANRKSLRVQ